MDQQRTTTNDAFQRTDPAAQGAESGLFQRTSAPTLKEEREPERPTSAFTRDAARLRVVMGGTLRPGSHDGYGTAMDTAVASSAVPPNGEGRGGHEKRQPTRLSSTPTVERTRRSTGNDESRTLQTRVDATDHATVVELRPNMQPERVPARHAIPADPFVRFDPESLPATPEAEKPAEPARPRVKQIEPEPIPFTKNSMPVPRKGKSLLVAGTIVTGVLLGIGLYAGGGDLLSTFFSNKHEGIATGNPAAITERPRPTQQMAQPPVSQPVTAPATEQPAATSPAATSAPAQSPAIVETAQPVAPPSTTQAQAPRMATAVTSPLHHPATLAPTDAGSSRSQAPAVPAKSKPTNLEPRTTKSPAIAAAAPPKKSDPEKLAAKRPSSTPMVRDIPLNDRGAAKREKAPANNFTVQVRATTDESEANLVAKRLKHRGMSDVVIVQSDRNGKPYYRVRYGSYKSNDDARAAAAKSGFDGTWVLKK